MLTFILLLLAVIGGYVAAIFTWAKVRLWLVGIDAEIMLLRDKARALEARLRARL